MTEPPQPIPNMPFPLNPFTGAFDKVNSPTNIKLVEYENADKPSAVSGDVWIKRTNTTDGTAGEPRGLLLSLTYTGDGIATYELSYKTDLNNIIRSNLT